MNVKTNDIVAVTQHLVFSNKHKICSARKLVWPKSQLLNSQED